MSNVLTVSHLCKEYPAFRLEDVSFTVEKGMTDCNNSSPLSALPATNAGIH